MIIDIVMFVTGLILLIIGIELIRMIHRAQKISASAPTYNKCIDQSIVDSGIFVRHGMVSKNGSRRIKSQSKKSDSYYKSIT